MYESHETPAPAVASAIATLVPPAPARVDEAPAFLSGTFTELDIRLDKANRALWCRLDPDGPPSFTPSMLQELNALHQDIATVFDGLQPGEEPPFLHYVQGSRIPGIFNMGGDFAFMKECVLAQNRPALLRYAYDCVESVHRIINGFDTPIVTIALVQGDALGGGFEGALCCNVIVAERSSRLGFPEMLFNTFPGMGAYSIVSRRLSPVMAEKMIMSGKVYSAEEMHEIGLVDILCEDGEGEAAVNRYIKEGRNRHNVRKAMFDVRQRANPVTLKELHDITEIWTDQVLRLTEADLRRMGHLKAAQTRRLAKIGKPA